MEKTRAFVLHIQKYTDTQRIVHLFTEQYGSVSVMIRISKSRKIPQRSALWQVLNLVDVDLDVKDGREIQYVKDANILNSWFNIICHPVKTPIQLFLAEFLHNALRGEGSNPALFQFIEQSIAWFNEADSNYANFHLVLMMRLTRFLGFWPNMAAPLPQNMGRQTGGVVFDMVNGCLSTTLPSHGQYLAGDDLRLLPLVLKMNYMQMHRVHLSRQDRWHMLDTILHYYHLHVPVFGDLQCLPVIRELFD